MQPGTIQENSHMYVHKKLKHKEYFFFALKVKVHYKTIPSHQPSVLNAQALFIKDDIIPIK